MVGEWLRWKEVVTKIIGISYSLDDKILNESYLFFIELKNSSTTCNLLIGVICFDLLSEKLFSIYAHITIY